MMRSEPIDATIMKATGLDKQAETAVCVCGCKKFHVIFDADDRCHAYCLNCRQLKRMTFADARLPV
jgi:hypothetical protein